MQSYCCLNVKYVCAARMCVFGYVKTQGNAGWPASRPAGWQHDIYLCCCLFLNGIFALAAQGPGVCRARRSLCGDQRDPPKFPLHTEEVTQPDLTQLSRAQ